MHNLDGALPVCFRIPGDNCASVILQGAGENFSGGSGVPVHENHKRTGIGNFRVLIRKHADSGSIPDKHDGSVWDEMPCEQSRFA